MLLTSGAVVGETTEKESGSESPPPGDGLKTVTVAVPVVTMSAAVMAACSWLLLMKLVGRASPFQRTSEDPTNPLPDTYKVNGSPPSVAEAG